MGETFENSELTKMIFFDENFEKSEWRIYGFRCLIMVFCVGVTMIGVDFGTLLAIGGANITSFTSFIIPGIAAMIFQINHKKQLYSIQSLLDISLIAYGVVILVWGNINCFQNL